MVGCSSALPSRKQLRGREGPPVAVVDAHPHHLPTLTQAQEVFIAAKRLLAVKRADSECIAPLTGTHLQSQRPLALTLPLSLPEANMVRYPTAAVAAPITATALVGAPIPTVLLVAAIVIDTLLTSAAAPDVGAAPDRATAPTIGIAHTAVATPITALARNTTLTVAIALRASFAIVPPACLPPATPGSGGGGGL